MNKKIINILCLVIFISIVAVAIKLLQSNGIIVNTFSLYTGLTLVLLASLSLLNTTVRNKMYHLFCKTDWAEETSRFYNNIPSTYRKSFWIIFGLINVAFLFHTINFLWGGDDWGAIRRATAIKDGLNEGRFSAYWLQEILFDGKILPVINNLWAFAGLALSGVLLSYYWNLEKKTSLYVIIGLFFAVNPYTLSWLYYAKNTLGNLWLPAFILTALVLSEKKSTQLSKNYLYNLFAIALTIVALGTYLPIISFILIAITGKLIINIITTDNSLKSALQNLTQTFANMLAAAMMFAFIMVILQEKGILADAYNTQLENILAIITKLPDTLYAMIEQLVLPMPFIDIAYKVFYLIIILTAIFTIIFKSNKTKTAVNGLLLLFLALACTKLTYLFSIQSFNNPNYVARIDFYSLPIFYTLMLSIICNLSDKRLYKYTAIFAILLIFMSFVRVSYAQKVWKFGWDAETKLAERIITRLEKMPEFDINRQYKLIQIGEQSLRKNYYIKKNNEYQSNELLNSAYYQEGKGKEAYNFYYQTDFIKEDAEPTALNLPQIKEYILTNARAWPAKESLAIINDYIIIILSEERLAQIRTNLNR